MILKKYPSAVPESPLEVGYGGRQEHWKRMEGFLRGRRRSRVAVHSTLDGSREGRAEKICVAV